jgi:hypothetical protein
VIAGQLSVQLQPPCSQLVALTLALSALAIPIPVSLRQSLTRSDTLHIHSTLALHCPAYAKLISMSI